MLSNVNLNLVNLNIKKESLKIFAKIVFFYMSQMTFINLAVYSAKNQLVLPFLGKSTWLEIRMTNQLLFKTESLKIN
jgi:hypothetical protein